MSNARRESSNLANIIAYALIGAIAFVVMKIEFPIMPGVGFLKFDFSDVVITVGTFLFGAGPGIFIAFIRTLISLIFSGFSLPSLVGQLAAFLATLSFALPFYYISRGITAKNRKTTRGLLMPIVGLVIGIVAMTAVMSLANAFVLTPVYAITSIANVPNISGYADLYNFTVKVYLGQLLHLPSMSAYVFGIIVPFNLLKGVINAVVVYILFESVLKSVKPFVEKRFNLK